MCEGGGSKGCGVGESLTLCCGLGVVSHTKNMVIHIGQSTHMNIYTSQSTHMNIYTSQSTHMNMYTLYTHMNIHTQVTKFARSAAQTFAPRASGAVKNPAYKGEYVYV